MLFKSVAATFLLVCIAGLPALHVAYEPVLSLPTRALPFADAAHSHPLQATATPARDEQPVSTTGHGNGRGTGQSTDNRSWVAYVWKTPPSPPPTPTPTLPPMRPTSTPPPPPSAAPTVVPPAPSHSIPASGEPVRIAIETPAGDHPVVTVGLDENRIPIVPKHEVGWYQYSARPGEGENVVLWGHVLRFRETPNKPAPFAGLKHTPIGSLITLYTSNNKTYSYVVTEKVWATPDQVAYILPQGQEQLTMVSCIGEQVIVNGSVEDMSHRLITIAMPVP